MRGMGEHRVIFADVLDGLRTLDAESVDMCATSPPYWNLRDYKHADQIGLEATPEAYVARLVEVFAEVRRVLKPGGTCWVNLGDSYASNAKGDNRSAEQLAEGPHTLTGGQRFREAHATGVRRVDIGGLKPKDLCGIPWRVAFALQADGWWLRNDIIWAKKNPMPESVTDRFSTKHEHVFLLSKQARYWFDLDAVREPLKYPDRTYAPPDGHKTAGLSAQGNRTTGGLHDGRESYTNPLGKNPGDVWRIATKPTPYAHFATWPPDLVERMILAGCPKGGIVLDPFAGSGTTTQVARKLGRRSIGIELNPAYEAVMRQRLGLPTEGTLFGDEDLSVEFEHLAGVAAE